MPVIKSSDPAHSTVGRPALRFDDRSQQGEAYLDQVRAQARELLEQARREASAIRQQQEAEARRAAEESIQQRVEELAREQTDKQLESLLPAMRQAAAALQQSRSEWLAQWERQAVQLAAAIAARVIRRELSRDPDIPLTLIREALEFAAGSPRLRVRLNPADHDALGETAATLAERLAPQASVEFFADAEISPGGCLVETEHGKIDQQIETQLARIEEELSK